MATQTLDLVVKANTSQASQNLRSFQTTFTELLSAVTLITAGFRTVAAVADEAFQFAKAGAELQFARDQFDRLATSIGTTSGALLSALQEASGGMVATSELMSSASQIISLGLADNEDDVVRLANVVTQLGLDMGQVILTFANNSELRLDALGLSVDTVREKAAALEAQGLDADKAFDLAVLEALEDRLELIGSAAGTAAGEFMQFEAEMTNAADALKIAFTNTGLVQGVMGDLSGTMGDAAIIIEGYNRGIISGWEALHLFAEQQSRVTRESEDHQSALASIRQELEGGLNPALLDAAAEAGSFDQAMIAAGQSVDEAGDSMEDATAATDEFSNSLNALEANLNLGGAIERMIEQLEFAAAGGLELQAQLEAAKEAYLAGDLDDAGLEATLHRAFVEAQEVQVAMGNITADEAAANIASTLNVSLEVASGLLNGVVDDLNFLNGQTFTAFMNLHTTYSSTGAPPIFPGGTPPGGFGGGAGGGGGVIPRQHGGPLSAGQLALVGERGPELFVPKQAGNVMSNDDLRQLLSGMGAGVVNVQVFLDGNEIGSTISTKLAQMGRRSSANASAYTGI